jgi:hypothetical protein
MKARLIICVCVLEVQSISWSQDERRMRPPSHIFSDGRKFSGTSRRLGLETCEHDFEYKPLVHVLPMQRLQHREALARPLMRVTIPTHQLVPDAE